MLVFTDVMETLPSNLELEKAAENIELGNWSHGLRPAPFQISVNCVAFERLISQVSLLPPTNSKGRGQQAKESR